MGSAKSDEMLILLKELSTLKELDHQYQSGLPDESGDEAHRLRQQRHREITEEIKALANPLSAELRTDSPAGGDAEV
jgi:hypothetical protein